VTVPFVLLGILQMLAITGEARTTIDFPALSARTFDEATLPNPIDHWKRVDYSSEHTDRPGATAEFGHSWLYTAGDLSVYVSVDYPFGGWHELTVCYKNIGWSKYERQVKEPQSEFSADGDFVEIDLCKPTGEHGLLLFGLFDMTGQPLTAGRLHWHQRIQNIVRNPLLSAIGYTELPAPSSMTTIQVQLFVADDQPVTPQQRQTMRERFELFRHLLRKKWMEETHRRQQL